MHSNTASSQRNQQIASNDFLPVKSISRQLRSPSRASEHELDVAKEKNKQAVQVVSTSSKNEVSVENVRKSMAAGKPSSSPKTAFSEDNSKTPPESNQKVLDLSRSSSCDAANDQSENITEVKSDDGKNSRSSSITPSFLASNSLTALAQLASNR